MLLSCNIQRHTIAVLLNTKYFDDIVNFSLNIFCVSEATIEDVVAMEKGIVKLINYKTCVAYYQTQGKNNLI